MTTGNDCLFFETMQKSGANNISQNSDNRGIYSNLSLNQNHRFLNLISAQSCTKPSKDKHYEIKSKKDFTAATVKLQDSSTSDNYEGKKKLQAWNKSSVISKPTLKLDVEVQEKVEKRKKKDDSITSNSTLSLHIAAFENSVEAAAFNGIKKRENKKELLTASTFFIQNPFEFPRQENDMVPEPEVFSYRASQQLCNPNKASTNAASNSASVATSSSSFLNPQLVAPEKVDAETINAAFKTATESIVHTLKLSQASEAHYNKLNLELAEKVSDQLTKIEVAKSILDTRMAAIQYNMSEEIDPRIIDGLLRRYKTAKDKLLLRKESLSKVMKSANKYFAQSNLEQMCETIAETHNRLLLLQKDINGGSNELEDQLEIIASLLEKFISLSFYGISASATSDTYEASLDKLEREEMLNDTLKHIRHVCECIKKAKEEQISEVTVTQTSQSVSVESLSDF